MQRARAMPRANYYYSIFLVLALALACNAQVNQPNAEGRVFDLVAHCPSCTPDCKPACGEIQVFNADLKCSIVPATVITSPSGNISFEQLMSRTPFQGGEIGFINSEAFFMAVEQIEADGTPVSICSSVFVTPFRPDVLIGACSVANASTRELTIQGLKARPIIDPENRVFATVQDEFGFFVDIATVPNQTPDCEIQGYFSPKDNMFFYNIFIVPGNVATLLPSNGFIAVLHAECRVINKDLRVIGGTRGQFSAPGTRVQVVMAPNGIPDESLALPSQVIRLRPGFQTFATIAYRSLPAPCTSHILVRIVGATGPGTTIMSPLILR